MKIDVLTLFPEFFSSPLNESLLKKAIDKDLLSVNRINIREFSQNKYHKVDDYPYGGGQGMVMAVEPIVLAYESIPKEKNSKTIFLSPQGQLLTQAKAKDLAAYDQLILLCGHYEGVDERAINLIVDEEISIGDYILTGGELPALVLIDAISRHIDGVVGSKTSVEEDSLSDGLLKYPQYTMPRSFRGEEVPEILLSGHHKNIENWRRELSLRRTQNKRPDLWASYNNKLKKEGK
ncbi:tRNA (guanine(37)-N(1))-methyltransferase [endosymbiont 'TC1' of Trimyema compressum]|uniref:tRNA (guanosine(37)-N1)-methyltransferase TrmD n=1 Tax=endosymbiont 'TC1' of Trimyema compressum TaxID=243899 RepID=UPI0007F13E3B|nr:tRNA (guanosine(37)-N1)-methyltransferase TrmD [endosymbiont 'TC1' of Trimyema compressum]AMP20582.1 tRNA (guanine(37)-N(1))-methyltransferase [endosymbiont 'TC1' of Trimyema compressum]